MGFGKFYQTRRQRDREKERKRKRAIRFYFLEHPTTIELESGGGGKVCIYFPA